MSHLTIPFLNLHFALNSKHQFSQSFYLQINLKQCEKQFSQFNRLLNYYSPIFLDLLYFTLFLILKSVMMASKQQQKKPPDNLDSLFSQKNLLISKRQNKFFSQTGSDKKFMMDRVLSCGRLNRNNFMNNPLLLFVLALYYNLNKERVEMNFKQKEIS